MTAAGGHPHDSVSNAMNDFLMGALAMASWVVGLYFLRFWRDTGDRLFAIFACAFWLLGLSRILLAIMHDNAETHGYLYLIRLLAFVLILIAIADKNRPRTADS